ncbi:hypothetical protein StrepF001_44210 [Streptomyces sp. F001]|uniref:hypothetical protein n=1 Tax=Streptomyces sp. F001 TaxID=1510026 RepID=UPI00101E48CE|nr:hypothetical protein [Streptomyces sp. F001]RZB13435.1 hypothetical protein StrepF001_44210 [Streptomyces sp. F001]
MITIALLDIETARATADTLTTLHDDLARIRAAMDRILAGRAEHSNGALTIVALAIEAKVPRNALTQRHTDLKAEFYEQVRARGGAMARPRSGSRTTRATARRRCSCCSHGWVGYGEQVVPVRLHPRRAEVVVRVGRGGWPDAAPGRTPAFHRDLVEAVVVVTIAGVLWGFAACGVTSCATLSLGGLRRFSRWHDHKRCWAIFGEIPAVVDQVTPLSPANPDHRTAVRVAAELHGLPLPSEWL